MKLLFDENISYRIVKKIAHLFPESAHIQRLGLLSKKDRIIWEFAKSNGFAIVTHDEDFSELSALTGPPPKVKWLRTGNTTTNILAKLLELNHVTISEFLSASKPGSPNCLEIYLD